MQRWAAGEQEFRVGMDAGRGRRMGKYRRPTPVPLSRAHPSQEGIYFRASLNVKLGDLEGRVPPRPVVAGSQWQDLNQVIPWYVTL